MSTWRLDVVHEADRIEEALERVSKLDPVESDAARRYVAIARASATRKRKLPSRLLAWWSGKDVEQAWLAIHAARQALFSVMPEEEVLASVPHLRSKARRYISAKSPDRKTYEDWLKDAERSEGKLERAKLRAVRVAVDRASDLKYANIRRFRNTLLVLMAAVTALLVVFIFDPPADTWLPVCGPAAQEEGQGDTPSPTEAVEPTADGEATEEADEAVVSEPCPRVWHIVLVGAAGGLLAVLVALRRMPATGEPYGLRRVQAALKIPVGALTGVIGVMLLQSDVIEALEPQPSPTVLVYAVIFGFSQEAVTRFIDKRAKDLLAGGEDEAAQ